MPLNCWITYCYCYNAQTNWDVIIVTTVHDMKSKEEKHTPTYLWMYTVLKAFSPHISLQYIENIVITLLCLAWTWIAVSLLYNIHIIPAWNSKLSYIFTLSQLKLRPVTAKYYHITKDMEFQPS